MDTAMWVRLTCGNRLPTICCVTCSAAKVNANTPSPVPYDLVMQSKYEPNPGRSSSKCSFSIFSLVLFIAVNDDDGLSRHVTSLRSRFTVGDETDAVTRRRCTWRVTAVARTPVNYSCVRDASARRRLANVFQIIIFRRCTPLSRSRLGSVGHPNVQITVVITRSWDAFGTLIARHDGSVSTIVRSDF